MDTWDTWTGAGQDRNCNTQALADAVRFRRVALVGNAESIIGTGQGAEIDDFEVVVRMSHAYAKPFPPADAGSRTDIWIFNGGAARLYIPGMPEEQRRLTVSIDRDIVREVGRFRPLSIGQGVARVTPLMGTVALYFILQNHPACVKVFGHDFFTTADPAAPNGRGEPMPVRMNERGRACHDHAQDAEATRIIYRLFSPRVLFDPIAEKTLWPT